jgi:hypothetical protein
MSPHDVRKSLITLALGALLGPAGCVHPFLPDMRTPADRAREVQPKCGAVTPEATAALLDPKSVDAVEPAYSYVKSGPNDHEARLRGALLRVRPLPGSTRESIARVLECHEAQVTLGQEQAAADDPYVLPDRWLDIDVDSEGDGFAVKAQIDEFDDAKKVLERAKSFASRRSSTP